MRTLAILEDSRQAAQDAERVRRQLSYIGSSTPPERRMRASLEARLRRDENLLARALDLIDATNITERQRDVLRLRYVAALDWRHVARAVGLSVKPCQTDARRAIEALESR